MQFKFLLVVSLLAFASFTLEDACVNAAYDFRPLRDDHGDYILNYPFEYGGNTWKFQFNFCRDTTQSCDGNYYALFLKGVNTSSCSTSGTVKSWYDADYGISQFGSRISFYNLQLHR